MHERTNRAALPTSAHLHTLMQVDGIGKLKLPLSHAGAESLKAVCEQAPFGRGTSTVVDTRVRNTWQLSPDKFQTTDTRSWDSVLASVMPQLCRGLGQDPSQVEAELYKLLLYEQGSFFAPHKDTEKVGAVLSRLAQQCSTLQGVCLAILATEVLLCHQQAVASHQQAIDDQLQNTPCPQPPNHTEGMVQPLPVSPCCHPQV